MIVSKNQLFDQYKNGLLTQDELIAKLEAQMGVSEPNKPDVDEYQQSIQLFSKLVYESKLRRMTNRKQPETMALTDLIDELMHMSHNAVQLATTSNEHITNIQIVFGNYLASQSIDDDNKNKMIKTQLWLIDNLLYFIKNYDPIAEANDVLCELGEFIDEHKNG